MSEFAFDIVITAASLVSALGVLCGVVWKFTGIVNDSISKQLTKAIEKGNEAQNKALVYLLKNEIAHLHKSHMKDGFIEVSELSTFNGMCDAYENLGGNDAEPKQRKEVNALPTRERYDAEHAV